MKVTVGDVMREINHCFEDVEREAEWRISEGRMSPDLLELKAGDWVALEGTGRNSGVFQVNEDGCLIGAADDSWRGRAWRLNPPESFLRLCGEIGQWCDEVSQRTAVSSEKFGAYSVTYADAANWRAHFFQQLKAWRKMFAKVGC